ncbi:hypothetical protein AB0H12_19020 [Actinosynnema sp. NPDC023794]
MSGKSGSLGYAAAIAGSCLAASLGLGLGLIYVPPVFRESPPAAVAEPPGTASDLPVPGGSTSWPTTTRTSTDETPVEFVGTSGPGGLLTVVPYSFTQLTTRVGSYSSRDPQDPEVEVRYGGAPPEGAGDLFESITRAAATTSSTQEGYRQLALNRARHGSFAAVEWEFEHRTAQGDSRWSRAHYWRAGGIEYVVLVQAPPHRRAEATRLLDTMIEHSRPQ